MKRDLPPFKSLRDMLSEPRTPTLYRIAEWQPIGTRVMLAAQFKAGKTTLVDNLIRSLIDGVPFLGSYQVTPIDGRLAKFDLEMSDAMGTSWLGNQSIENDDRVWPIFLRGQVTTMGLLDAQTRDAWAQHLRANDVRYVIWDCVRPLIDACGLNEDKDAGRLLTAFDAMLYQAGITEATVVQHMGHSGERARGDSRFRDWPDVEWRLVRQDENPNSPRFMSAYGRDVDRPETQLFYDRTTRHLIIAGGSRRDARIDDLVPDIVEAIGDAELTGRDIGAKRPEGALRNDWRDALKRAIADGLVVTKPGPNRSVLHSAPVR